MTFSFEKKNRKKNILKLQVKSLSKILENPSLFQKGNKILHLCFCFFKPEYNKNDNEKQLTMHNRN